MVSGDGLRYDPIVPADHSSICQIFARAPLRVIIPAWFLMMAVFYWGTWPWRAVLLYDEPAAWLASGFLVVTAILIYHRSPLDFSRPVAKLAGEIVTHQQRRLVTEGIRQRIRHPIYLAHLCMLVALTVGSGEVVLFGLTVVALLTGWPMIRQEEADLEDRYGEEYRAYKRAVPAVLIPCRLFRPAKAKDAEIRGSPEERLRRHRHGPTPGPLKNHYDPRDGRRLLSSALFWEEAS